MENSNDKYIAALLMEVATNKVIIQQLAKVLKDKDILSQEDLDTIDKNLKREYIQDYANEILKAVENN